jgi:phage virion morphogenesis protein
MAEITVKVDDESVQKALAELAGKMADRSPVMKVIGEYMVRSTEDRFKRQGPAPDGSPWAPLKPSTLKRKKHSKTLTESGALRGDIHYQLLGANGVSIGTTGRVPYGAIHQLGGRTAPRVILPNRKKALRTPYGIFKKVNHPGSVIPARPFLGVSDTDSGKIVGIINHYLGMR